VSAVKWKKELVYLVYLNCPPLQVPADDIDSIWTSIKKAEKRKKELTYTYGEGHIIIFPYQLSK
jgi:hypothetical protein